MSYYDIDSLLTDSQVSVTQSGREIVGAINQSLEGALHF